MQNPVLTLTCAIGVIGANSLLLSPIAGTVSDSFANATPADVLVGVSSYGIGTAISALLLAPMGDRFGADRVIGLALLVLTLGLALSAMAPNVVTIWAAQAVAGLAAGAALPSIYTLAASVAAPGQEVKTMGRVLTGWTLSLVAGVSLSAVLTDLIGWRAVFGLLAAVSLLLMANTMRTDFGNVARGRSTSPLTAMDVPGIGRALASAFLTMLAFYGTYTFSGVHFTETLGQTTTVAGIFALLYGAGFGCAAWVDPYMARYPHRVAALVVFSALVVAYMLFGALANSYVGIIAAAFGWGIINHLSLNLIVTRLTALDAGQRGAIMGLYSCVTYVAVTLSALSFAPVYAWGGWAACAMLSAGLVIVMVAEIAIPRRSTVQG